MRRIGQVLSFIVLASAVVSLVVVTVGCGKETTTTKAEELTEENKAIARREYEEIWNQGKLDVADEILDASYAPRGLGVELPPGPEGFKPFVSMYRSAFPDIHFTIEDQIAEGDKVVLRWTARATHKGELMGIPATGKQIEVTGIDITQHVGGKIVASWNNWDALGMMEQLGVVPPME